MTTHCPRSIASRSLRGFTLTEIAIVLGIIGIILGAIWAAAAMVYENNRSQEAAQQTLAIANNWKSVYGSRKVDIADWTAITEITANDNYAPADMYSPVAGYCPQGGGAAAGCVLQGPWTSSQVTVYTLQSWNAVVVLYNLLTQAACNHYADALANAAGLVWIDISGTQTYFQPLAGQTTPLLTSQVATQCSAANSGNYVYVGFAMN